MVGFVKRVVVDGFWRRRDYERFYLVFGGHILFQTLHSAVEFDLFTRLDRAGSLTADQIARQLGLAAQPTRILLLGLTSTGFLRKSGVRYRNAPVARELLSADSPMNVLAYVRLQHQGVYRAMHHMTESLRTHRNEGLQELSGDEPTLYERLAHQPALAQIFQDAMQQLSVQTNRLFAGLVDLSDVKHLVDVGGCDGTNLITLARRYPHLRGTVFDLPSVCAIARRNIAVHGLSDRLRVVEGHCFESDFPRDADTFLFSHFFTIWSKEKDLRLLQKALAALPSGGRAMIFNMMQRDDGTGPLSAAVGSPYFLTLATGEGMLYAWREYEELFRLAGFVDMHRQRLPSDHGVIWGRKP
jgi:predicted O-methyltransferase YrrM